MEANKLHFFLLHKFSSKHITFAKLSEEITLIKLCQWLMDCMKVYIKKLCNLGPAIPVLLCLSIEGSKPKKISGPKFTFFRDSRFPLCLIRTVEE